MSMNLDLFDEADPQPARSESIGPRSVVLRGYALPVADALLQSLDEVIRQSPFRRMETPGGHLMSVALSNCGRLGWTTDHDGYRYTPADPLSGRPWPDMPPAFAALGREAAAAAGFAGFPHSDSGVIL